MLANTQNNCQQKEKLNLTSLFQLLYLKGV